MGAGQSAITYESRRPETYQESLYTMLTLPFIRSMMPASPMENAYAEVLGRLAKFKQINPQLAMSITSDKQFMLAISSESDQKKIEEKVDNHVLSFANSLRETNATLTQNVEEKGDRLDKLEKRLGQVEEAANKDKINHRAELDSLNEQLKEEKQQRRKAEADASYTRTALTSFKMVIVKWSVFAGLLAVLSPALWYFLRRQRADLPNAKFLMLGILLEFIMTLLLLNIPLHRKWAPLVGISCPFIIAALGLVWSIS